ncbi:cytochrome c-type biogenesis protein [Niveibacterium sp. SC-1]|uniref:cytochrome c-type biogenesis protein n=1 Tax=Niveibacterium sp. SC-1 TaxID=3135646 RepID=UPI00311F8795
MRYLLTFLLVLLSATPVLAGEARPLAQDEAVEQRLINIAQELRCLVCQNESLAGSRAELAEDLRREVREQIRAGKSDQEIKDYLVARYGNFVLYRPPLEGSTVLLWVGPFVLLVGAAAGLLLFVRRRARQSDVPLDAMQREQAEKLLADISAKGPQ